jgi:hypothetical protein
MRFLKTVLFLVVLSLLCSISFAQFKIPFGSATPPKENAYAYTNEGIWTDSFILFTKYKTILVDTALVMFNTDGKGIKITKATIKKWGDGRYAYIGDITSSGLTMNTSKLLGRTTASSGAIEEISVTTASGINLLSGTLALSAIPNSSLSNSTISGISLGSNLGTLTISSPLTGTSYNGSTGISIGIQNAAADGTTKGASAYTASDFNATSGLISLDYTNGQQAASSQNGFLSSTDWSTFNNKVSTTKTITTTSPLTGGGDLSSNRTFALAGLSGLGTANQMLGMNSGATAYEYKTLSVGTSGSDFAISHGSGTIALNLPDAGSSARGAVTTTTQTFAGNKTFSGSMFGAGSLQLGGYTGSMQGSAVLGFPGNKLIGWAASGSPSSNLKFTMQTNSSDDFIYGYAASLPTCYSLSSSNPLHQFFGYGFVFTQSVSAPNCLFTLTSSATTNEVQFRFDNGTSGAIMEIVRLASSNSIRIYKNTGSGTVNYVTFAEASTTINNGTFIPVTGTTTLAPVTYVSGTLTTTASGGYNEYNNSFYQTKNSGLRYGVGGIINEQYTDVNNSGTGETDLYTYTTPANTLEQDGGKLIGRYAGTFNDATATAQIKVYFGGTSIFDSGTLTLSTTGAFNIDLYIVRTSSTTARAIVNMSTPSASTSTYTTETDLTGLTLSGTNIIKMTGTAGGVGGGSNDITAKLSFLSWQPKANN